MRSGTGASLVVMAALSTVASALSVAAIWAGEPPGRIAIEQPLQDPTLLAFEALIEGLGRANRPGAVRGEGSRLDILGSGALDAGQVLSPASARQRTGRTLDGMTDVVPLRGAGTVVARRVLDRALSAPKNLTLTRTISGAVALSWDHDESRVLGFVIEEAGSADGKFREVQQAAADRRFAEVVGAKSVVPKRRYRFRMKSLSENSESRPSQEVSYEGGSPGFTPKELDGNLLWLRSDTGVKTDAQGRVSEWQDPSDLGRSTIQSVESFRPVAPVRPGSGIEFDGSYLQITPPVEHAKTVAFVGRIDCLTAANHQAWLGGGGPWYYGLSSLPSNGRLVAALLDNEWRAGSLEFDGGTHLYVHQQDAGRSRVWVDERLDLSHESTATPGDGELVYIGKHIDPAQDRFLCGEILEIIAYSRGISEDERRRLEGYLRVRHFFDPSSGL